MCFFFGLGPKTPSVISMLRNSGPLKNSGWKTAFLLKWPLFRGHVSFWVVKPGAWKPFWSELNREVAWPPFFLGGGDIFLKCSLSRVFLSGNCVFLDDDRPVGFLIAQIARIFKNDRLLLGDTADGFETWLTNYCKHSLSWNLQCFVHPNGSGFPPSTVPAFFWWISTS